MWQAFVQGWIEQPFNAAFWTIVMLMSAAMLSIWLPYMIITEMRIRRLRRETRALANKILKDIMEARSKRG